MGAGLERRFGWLWGAYAVSAYGSGLGFGAFSYVAITVLHVSAAQVSTLSAVGLTVGALLAVPSGPWVEFRAKRPVMVGMDVVRFAAVGSVPVAYWMGVLTFAQLVVVSVVVAAARIVFDAASGAYLKSIVPAGGLLTASSRFESTTWSATVVGPVLGGAAMGVIGPVVTVVADAVSYLLSALGVTAIGGTEPVPPVGPVRPKTGGLLIGWRCIWEQRALRRLFLNGVVVSALIMAAEPPLTYLMLGRLGFPAWQYGLAFALPCLGGLVGSRLAGRFVARHGQVRVLVGVGALRSLWPVGLAFVRPGVPGLVVVMAVELALIVCIGLHNPVVAAYRLETVDSDRLARVLAAWKVTSNGAIAAATAVWGVLADLAGPRAAIAAAGVLLIATPVLLPRRRDFSAQRSERNAIVTPATEPAEAGTGRVIDRSGMAPS